MSTLTIDIEATSAKGVVVSDDSVLFELNDGRTVTVPIAWYPRLMYGTPEERK